MKTFIAILGVLAFFFSGVHAYAQKDTTNASPYQPGERLSYLIHYGFINGGNAVLYMEEDTLFGKDVHHIVISGWTTGLADALFKIRDTYESYVDPETDLPVKAIRDIREGRYKRYNEVTFDRESRSDSTILHSQRSGMLVVDKYIHDILSAFYYFRKYQLPPQFEKGEIIEIMTYFTDELYPIRLRYMGKETVKTKVGKVACYKFNPVTEVGRLFKTEDDMTIWFSRDDNFLPVKIRFELFIGSVQIDLMAHSGLSHEFTSLRKK
jgi:hypothetical protein